MNTESKLVAAAKRAARKISHAENIPHQTALDRVARQAGRSTWSAFVADPVAIDRTSADAASEPDFTTMSPEAHLLGAIDHGISIGARALVARPEVAGKAARLVYCSSRSEDFDHPIDARGISVTAMIASLAIAPSIEDGRVRIQDGTFAFELDDLGGASQLRLSLDEKLPPVAPLVQNEDMERQDESRRQQRLGLRSKAVLDVPPVPSGINPLATLDTLVCLAWQTMRADIHFQPQEVSVDVVMQVGDVRRVVHVMSMDDYKTVMAATKDRARMDQMEFRVPQHGDWTFEIEGERGTVSAVTAPVPGMYPEALTLGFMTFPKRTYASRPYYEHPQGGKLLLGEHGLFQRTKVHAAENSLIVVSGARGSGRTSSFVVPAIMEGDGADVIVSDMEGDMTDRLGETWTAGRTILRIDPRTAPGHRAPAFNPLHPDMNGTGHLATAEWIAHTLLPEDDVVSDAARSLFIGAVDVVVVEPRLRIGEEDQQKVATLPMVRDWLQRNGRRLEEVVSDVATSRAINARIRIEKLLSMSPDARRETVDTVLSALSFVTTPGMTGILAPVDEDRGAALASALVLKRTPALVIVGGDDLIGQGVLCALVMQAAMHLKEDLARRETHVFVDDAKAVGPMPWLRKALTNVHGTRVGISAVVVLESPHEIDLLAPRSDDGTIPGITHWIVEEVGDPADRARIADAMSVRRAKVTSHRADRHRLDVGRGTVRQLRR